MLRESVDREDGAGLRRHCRPLGAVHLRIRLWARGRYGGRGVAGEDHLAVVLARLLRAGLEAAAVADAPQDHRRQDAHGQEDSQEEAVHRAEPEEENGLTGVCAFEPKGGNGGRNRQGMRANIHSVAIMCIIRLYCKYHSCGMA